MKTPSKQSVTCNVMITSYLIKGDCLLPPNKEYTLVIDYPLESEVKIKINTGKRGLGTNALIGKICSAYQKIYDKEDACGEDENGDTKYGIWGHDIDDLALEGIYVDHKKRLILIDVGS